MSAEQTTPTTASPLRMARRVVVAVIGATVLAIGIVLIVLPGPAFLVIPMGLAILATEFLWARRLLRRVKEGAASAENDMIRLLDYLGWPRRHNPPNL